MFCTEYVSFNQFKQLSQIQTLQYQFSGRHVHIHPQITCYIVELIVLKLSEKTNINKIYYSYESIKLDELNINNLFWFLYIRK